MSLLQSRSLITTAISAYKNKKAPDLQTVVNVAAQVGVINRGQASAVKSGLRIADSLIKGKTPDIGDALSAITRSGVLSRNDSRNLSRAVAIGLGGLAPTQTTQRTIAQLRAVGAITNSQASLLRDTTGILNSANKGDWGSVAQGAMRVAGLDRNTTRILGAAFDALLTTTETAERQRGYESKPSTLPRNSVGIGKLTKTDIVTILTEIRKGIAEKYPVNGPRNHWKKVHSRGEYGAYRITLAQMVETNFITEDILDWSERAMEKAGTKSGNADRYKTYAEVISERAGADYDVAPYKQELANSKQYFFMYNPIPPNYATQVRNMTKFVTDEKLQDQVAYWIMENAYKKLLFAKTITPETDRKTVAGLLALSLAENPDTAILYASGTTRTNSDGINTKYWYDLGWNAIAEVPREVTTEEPVLKPGAKKPTTKVSNKALLDTATELSGILASRNLNKVVDGLVRSGNLSRSTGGILKAGLGMAADSIKEKIKEINTAKAALDKAGAVLPKVPSASSALSAVGGAAGGLASGLSAAKDAAKSLPGTNSLLTAAKGASTALDANPLTAAASSLDKVTSISNAISDAPSIVPSMDTITKQTTGISLTTINKLSTSVEGALLSPNLASVSATDSVSNLKSTTAIAKKITTLANEVEQDAHEAVGTAVGAVAASGECSPESLSFIGEALKGGMGLGCDPNAAVVNELNRRGMCPPGATALLNSSLEGITDPAKIADKIATVSAKQGGTGSVLPSLNMKLIESTGAEKGMVDAFTKAKSEAIVAVGGDKAGIIGKAGTASVQSMAADAQKAASSMLSSVPDVGKINNLGADMSSLTTGAQDAVAAAGALGAAAMTKVPGSAAADAVSAGKDLLSDTKSSLTNASGAIDATLADASNSITETLKTGIPSDGAPASTTGKIISSFLPVDPAEIPPIPDTGTNSAEAVPQLPASKIAAITGDEPSTPPTDPNPIVVPYGATVKAEYYWASTGGIVAIKANDVIISSVNGIDLDDTNMLEKKKALLVGSIDGAIRVEETANVETGDINHTTTHEFYGSTWQVISKYSGTKKTVGVGVKQDDVALNNGKSTSYSNMIAALLDSNFESVAEIVKQHETYIKSILEERKSGIQPTAISSDLKSLRSALPGEIVTNLQKVKKTFSNNTPVASQEGSVPTEDGSTVTTVVEKFGDGSKVTTTITETQTGFVTVTKSVERIAPPIIGFLPDLTTVNEDSVVSPAQSDNTPPNPAPADATSIPSNESILPPERQSPNAGFKDPHGQYPKVELAGKPDTNPLAVGTNSPDIQSSPNEPTTQDTLGRGSSPAAKTATRLRDVPKAGRHGGSWSQPESPYNAQYPYNKVFAGESGHAIEIDDTPGAERINISHRTGTFTEIGPDGTQVNRIVGDGYMIVDNDGFISIQGKASIHIAGECNVMIMNDCNLTTNGKLNMDVHSDFNLNVAGALSIAAGQGIFMRNEGVFSLENTGNIEVHTPSDFNTTVDGTINQTATTGYRVTSKADHHTKVAGETYLTSVGDINVSTDANSMWRAAEEVNSKSGTHTNIESLGNTNIKAAGSVNSESIASFNIKSENVVNVQAEDAINVKTETSFNTHSTGTTNIKADNEIITQSANVTYHKASQVISSKILTDIVDTTTLNASTTNTDSLNAKATNLKGTHTSPDDTTDIKGPSGASVSAPTVSDALAAGEANTADPASEPELALVAEQAIIVPVEQPVSVSVASVSEGSSGQSSGRGGRSTSGGGSASSHGGASAPMQNDGGDIDETTGTRIVPDSACSEPSSGGANVGDGDYTPSSEAGPFGTSPSISGRNIDVDMDGNRLPPLRMQGPIDPSIKLSKYYHLRDLLFGMTPRTVTTTGGKTYSPWDIVKNLRTLAVLVLDPVRARFGSNFVISSCYRNNRLDSRGRAYSAHNCGLAADTQYISCGYSPQRTIEAARIIAQMNIPHDQIILERANRCRNPWIHLGIANPTTGQQRGQKFTMNNDSTVRSGPSATFTGFVQFPGW
jgi:hypothetical protein